MLFRSISLLSAVLTTNTQIAHSTIAAHVSLGDPNVRHAYQNGIELGLGRATVNALAAVIDRQAAVIAYLDDFKLLAIAMLAMIPLLFLMRGPRPGVSTQSILTE